MSSEFESVWGSREKADRFLDELRNYRQRVRTEIERRIRLRGAVTGFVLGVFLAILVQGKMDSDLPEIIVNYRYVSFGVLLLLASIFIGHDISDGIYKWALRNNITAGLDSVFSGFGESKVIESRRLAQHILEEADLVKIDIKYHESTKKAAFPSSASRSIYPYFFIVSLVCSFITLGISIIF